MISKEQVEIIAERYGIGVSYKQEHAGGFVVDETGTLKKSIIDEIVISLKGK